MDIVGFKLIIGIMMILTILVHGHHGVRRTRRESQTISRRNRLERSLILAAFLVWAILTATYLLSPILDRFNSYLLAYLRWIGVFVLLMGDICLVLAHLALGKNWSLNPEIRDSHVLIINGVYKLIRHPMYTAYLMIGIGFLLSSANLLVGPIFLAPIIVVCWVRIGIEEKMMLEQFGDEYREYAQRTGSLLPKIGFRRFKNA